jgi:outer membrane lipoprotein-sorting protein
MHPLILSILCAAVAAATAPQPETDTLTELDKVLAQIDARAQGIHSLRATFTQVDFDPIFEEQDTSSGTVRLVRTQPGGAEAPPIYQIRFDYMEPERSVTIVDASRVIVWTPEMEAPEESYLIDDTKMQTLLAGFISTERLREHYDVMIETQSSHTVTLRLVPKSEQARQQFREMRITFSKRTWLPTTIYHFKLNGQNVTFTFDNVKLNTTIPGDVFTAGSLASQVQKAQPARSRESARQ